VRADDQGPDGRISARELVGVTARVWNAGPGIARQVKASLGTGDDTLRAERTRRRPGLPRVRAGRASLGEASNRLMDQVRANERMYTRFRATKAYKELEAEVQRYEAWKRSQK
jgi:hypothetical protein